MTVPLGGTEAGPLYRAWFTGHTALITGGASGIGLATALALAQAGARVLICGRREAEGRRAEGMLRAHQDGCRFLPLDLRSPDSIAAMFDEVSKMGPLHHAFNCAGCDGLRRPLLEADPADWRAILETNVQGTLHLLQGEVSLMRHPGQGGSIVNMGSGSGLMARPGRAAYNASRAAVHSLTRTAAVEAISHGVRVNAVAPGPVRTDIFERMTGGDLAQAEAYARQIPVGRVAEPGEIAQAVLWLLSPLSSFVVGHVLSVDGGWSLR